MADKKDNIQTETIPFDGPYIDLSFDLDRLDSFIQNLGVDFIHYKSIPSPIGQNDKGDYHRSDGVDTITSNGMIYKCAGIFRAVMTDNSRDKERGEAGVLDPSQSRLVLPRFYKDGKRIRLLPGDRIYSFDLNTDDLVPNEQKMEFELGVDNILMFPAVELELPIIGPKGEEYAQGVDFCITSKGDIRWLPNGKNPGIDPQTGKGRIYSIRYLYKSYWYITQLLKEVRVTNVTANGERKPERMPYHCIVTREYMFRNQNRGDVNNQLKPKDTNRTVKTPVETQIPVNPSILVDMSNISDSEE